MSDTVLYELTGHVSTLGGAAEGIAAWAEGRPLDWQAR